MSGLKKNLGCGLGLGLGLGPWSQLHVCPSHFMSQTQTRELEASKTHFQCLDLSRATKERVEDLNIRHLAPDK